VTSRSRQPDVALLRPCRRRAFSSLVRSSPSCCPDRRTRPPSARIEYSSTRAARFACRPDDLDRGISMQLTPREFDKLLVYMLAEVALKRKAKGIKLNYPEAVAIISAAALDGARAGKTIEEVAKEARTALTRDDVMDGVADLIPMVQVEAVFTDGSRLVTVHTPIQ
jgi:urease subunit gamma